MAKIPELTTELPQYVKINGKMFYLKSISQQNYVALLRLGGKIDDSIIFTFVPVDEPAKAEMKDVRNYLNGIKIPPGDVELDLVITPKYHAMKLKDAVNAEVISKKLAVWIRQWVYQLEVELRTQIEKMGEK